MSLFEEIGTFGSADIGREERCMGEGSSKGQGRVFLGLSALLLWLFIVLTFGMQIANTYESTINTQLGISTMRVVGG